MRPFIVSNRHSSPITLQKRELAVLDPVTVEQQSRSVVVAPYNARCIGLSLFWVLQATLEPVTGYFPK